MGDTEVIQAAASEAEQLPFVLSQMFTGLCQQLKRLMLYKLLYPRD